MLAVLARTIRADDLADEPDIGDGLLLSWALLTFLNRGLYLRLSMRFGKGHLRKTGVRAEARSAQ